MIPVCIARLLLLVGAVLAPIAPTVLAAQEVAQGVGAPEHRPGGEVNLRLPDLNQGDFLGFTGHEILLSGLLVCVLGLLFGLWSYNRVKNLPVHRSMAEISELIYVTCKAYMVQQGKLLLVLFGFIGTVIVIYFLRHRARMAEDRLDSSVQSHRNGRAAMAWPGSESGSIRSPTRGRRSPACRGKAWPVSDIPLRAGMSVGMMLISVELLFMLGILLFIPSDVAGACFLGFAIGESLGAAALRIAGGIFTKIADIGSDLMKVVFKIKEDDARNPGVIADCTGDNAGDSVGPDRRRLRDLRRHRRRADLVHRARGDRHVDPGAAARVDLPDARDDGAGLRLLLPDQQRGFADPVCGLPSDSTSRRR